MHVLSVIIFVLLIVVAIWKRQATNNLAEFSKNYTERVQLMIAPHIKTLCLKFDQTVFVDEYGNHVFTLWERDRDYFIDSVLQKDDLIRSYLNVSFPNDRINEKYERSLRRIDLGGLITGAIVAYKESQTSVPTTDVETLDPIEFECHCSSILTDSGWVSRTTKGSGDQGIDIIATYNGVKAVFQCKKYSQPVGNAAVQEIIAGKLFEQADHAAVVSNAPYTSSAKQLASTTGVHLLHYSELQEFADRISV